MLVSNFKCTCFGLQIENMENKVIDDFVHYGHISSVESIREDPIAKLLYIIAIPHSLHVGFSESKCGVTGEPRVEFLIV